MQIQRKRRGRPSIRIPLEDLPNRARPLRESLGLNLETVARQVGTGINALSEFERMGTGLGRQKQFLLADALGVDYVTLITPGKKFVEKVRQSMDINSVRAV